MVSAARRPSLSGYLDSLLMDHMPIAGRYLRDSDEINWG
jgi:hypothetical protein